MALERLFPQFQNYLSIIIKKLKLMKPFKSSINLILGALTFFVISSANAGGCSSHNENKAEIECLSDDKKCIDAKEKESLYEVEA